MVCLNFFLFIGIDDYLVWEMLDTYGIEGKVSIYN